MNSPFVTGMTPGRMHLALRTLAANDNLPLAATAPPRRAALDASTRWPIVARVGKRDFFAKLAVLPAPTCELGVEAGGIRGARR